MNSTRLISLFVCCLIFPLQVRCFVLQLFQNHVAGPRVNFLEVPWSVNPDEGLIRRTEYEAINGRYGYKHVERIGLGQDGRTEERRIQQRLRDAVGALSYQPPSSYNSVPPH